MESPHRNYLFTFSFPFGFYCWTSIDLTCWMLMAWAQQKYMKCIAARVYQVVADALRLSKWNKALKTMLALHTQDNGILWIQMMLSRSGNSSTGLRASFLGQWVFTLIFITFGLDLYILRPTCLAVLIRQIVVAFHISAHSGSKCYSYSYNSGKTTPNNPFLTSLAC